LTWSERDDGITVYLIRTTQYNCLFDSYNSSEEKVKKKIKSIA